MENHYPTVHDINFDIFQSYFLLCSFNRRFPVPNFFCVTYHSVKISNTNIKSAQKPLNQPPKCNETINHPQLFTVTLAIQPNTVTNIKSKKAASLVEQVPSNKPVSVPLPNGQ